jgi:hypothetical protein
MRKAVEMFIELTVTITPLALAIAFTVTAY